jgi:multicomponent Na+:H+ antiporter subunit E
MKKTINFLIRILRFLAFVVFYLKELVVSSTLLARDILRPGPDFCHGIVAIDIDLKKDTSIIALSNLLSMTPGSLLVEYSPERKKLYVHSMYLHDIEAFRKKIKTQFEQPIKAIFE